MKLHKLIHEQISTELRTTEEYNIKDCKNLVKEIAKKFNECHDEYEGSNTKTEYHEWLMKNFFN